MARQIDIEDLLYWAFRQEKVETNKLAHEDALTIYWAVMALPVPFGDALPGLTLAIFGLAIVQRDGFAVIAGLVGTAVCGVYLALIWTAVVAAAHGIAGWFAGLF